MKYYGAIEDGKDLTTKEYVDGKQALVFRNKTVKTTDFKADTTYSMFPYAATISTSKVTQNDIPEVVFSAADAISNNFAPICSAENNAVIIYAATVPAADIMIPTIIVEKSTA